GDAWPVIGDLKRQPVASKPASVDGDAAVAASLQNRLFRVDEQVQDHLLELIRIGQRWRKTVCQAALDNDVFDFEFITAQGQGALHNLVEVHAGALGFCLPGKKEQVLDDAAGALRLLEDLLGLAELGRSQAVAEEKLRIAHDGRERIVQLVSDTGN